MEHAPYYGKKIHRKGEQDYIQKIVSKYQAEPATEELKTKIYDELMWEKHLGNVTIPFQVVLYKDQTGHGVDYIDVILDSKV